MPVQRRMVIGGAVLLALASMAYVGSAAAGRTSSSHANAQMGKSKVVLRIGTSGDFPPYEFRNSANQVIGFIPDILKYALPRVGMSYKYVQVQFAGIIPALTARRIDMITALYDLPAREKQVSFMDFARERLALLVAKPNVAKYRVKTNLCGTTIGALVGAPETATLINTLSTKYCTSQSKPAIQVATYPSDPQEIQDIENGRIAGGIDGSSVFGYAAKKSGGRLAVAFQAGGASIEGWAVRHHNPLERRIAHGLQLFLNNKKAVRRVEKRWGLPSTFFFRKVKKTP